MREMQSFTIPNTSGALGTLPTDGIEFSPGSCCPGVMLYTDVPISSGGFSPKLGDALDFFRCLFATFILGFGTLVRDVVDNSLTFDDLRQMCIALTGRDMRVVALAGGAFATGAAVSLSDAAGAGANLAGAGAAMTLRLVFERPFVSERMGDRMLDWAPGWRQMSQIRIQTKRGATFNPTNGIWTQSGAATCTYVPRTRDATHDRWAQVPRLFKQNEFGLVSRGPAGALIAVWEQTAVGAATSLNLFSVERANDAPLHENVAANKVVQDAFDDTPLGSVDLNTLATVLWQLPDQSSFADLPVGAGFAVRQMAQDLQPLNTAWLYVPTSTSEAANAVARNLLDKASEGEQVQLVSTSALHDENSAPHVSSVSPMSILPKGHPSFGVVPGVLATKAGGRANTAPFVSELAATKGQAQVSHAGAAADAGASAKAIEHVAKFIPGAVTPSRTAGLTAGLSAVADRMKLKATALMGGKVR